MNMYECILVTENIKIHPCKVSYSSIYNMAGKLGYARQCLRGVNQSPNLTKRGHPCEM